MSVLEKLAGGGSRASKKHRQTRSLQAGGTASWVTFVPQPEYSPEAGSRFLRGLGARRVVDPSARALSRGELPERTSLGDRRPGYGPAYAAGKLRSRSYAHVQLGDKPRRQDLQRTEALTRAPGFERLSPRLQYKLRADAFPGAQSGPIGSPTAAQQELARRSISDSNRRTQPWGREGSFAEMDRVAQQLAEARKAQRASSRPAPSRPAPSRPAQAAAPPPSTVRSLLARLLRR